MMLSRLHYLIVLAVATGAVGLGTVAAVTVKSWQTSETIELEMNWEEESKDKKINLNDYADKFKQPAVCSKATVICTEHMKVKMIIEKVYQIRELAPLDSAELSAEDFSNYYPPVKVSQVSPTAPPGEIMVVQRTLYERGLLPVLPTGKYGALTEQAVLHFRQIKGNAPCSDEPVIADAETIKFINILKENMKQPGYLSESALPPLDENALCPRARERLTLLRTYTNALNTGTTKPVIRQLTDEEKQVQVILPGATELDQETLKMNGFIELAK